MWRGIQYGVSRMWALLDQVVVTKVKHLLGTTVVLFLIFGLITWQVRSLVEADRRGDLRDAALVTHQIELDAYQTSLVQYNQCLDMLRNRHIYRERFIASALAKKQIIDIIAINSRPEAQELIDQLYAVIDQELASIDEGLPVLPRDTCPAEAPSRPVFTQE